MRLERLRKQGVAVVTTLAVGVLAVLAALSPGQETTDLSLTDGGVWITNSSARLVGHLNSASRRIDGGMRVAAKRVELFQQGQDVFASLPEESHLNRVDVSTATLGAGLALEGLGAQVGGGTVTLVDAAGGRLWSMDAADFSSFVPSAVLNPKSAELSALAAAELEPTPGASPEAAGHSDTRATVQNMPGAVVAAGVDGSVHAASAAAGQAATIWRSGEQYASSTRPIGTGALAELEVAGVGAKTVVLDRAAGVLYLPGGVEVEVAGAKPTLQESGPAASEVAVATTTELLIYPITGGEPQRIATPAIGTPVRPVLHAQCYYAAWTGSGAHARHCADASRNLRAIAPSLAGAKTAVYRTNRDVIVLNDTTTGNVWLPEDGMDLVNDWDALLQDIEQRERENKNKVVTSEQLAPERTEKNNPPVAQDDDLGVRPGRSTVLPVVANDTDLDGDFLTAKPLSQPSIGRVSVARAGAALAIEVPGDASGTSTFEYEVSDGRGGTDRATVTLTVRGERENHKPVQRVPLAVTLGQGKSATVNGLDGWWDPDGDPIFIDAVIPPSGLRARALPAGTVDLRDAGLGAGRYNVPLLVSDGRESGEGTLAVTVVGAANLPPVTNADFLVVRVGSTATLNPLANDTDPNGDELRLVKLDDAPLGLSAKMVVEDKLVVVQGTKAGTYYLNYLVADGAATTPGTIRVDVVEGNDQAPPSVEDDLGVLDSTGQVLVSPLVNDTDPTGGVLTINGVHVPPSSSLQVAVIEHHLLRVTAPRGLAAPQTFTYTVSNEFGSAVGTVTIMPASGNDLSDPPELSDDTLVVRSGDVGAVKVLANDRSPGNLKLTVLPTLEQDFSADLATVFVSDNVVRVRGGASGGSGKIVYTVQDTAGNAVSAQINLTVVPLDAASNQAPRPKDLTAWGRAGGQARIPVPLDGIDPDGDSVSLVGPASPPRQGIVEVREGLLIYTANKDAVGTDFFTYEVEDKLGRHATASVRVGIAPRSGVNQPPVAVQDIVVTRPGSRIGVSVTANDLDADGDQLSLVEDSVVSQASSLRAAGVGGRIVATAPHEEGSYTAAYDVTDGRGGSATGILTVTVRKDAPLLAPIARDDVIDRASLSADQATTVVDVLKNDEDPDGDIGQAEIASSDPGVKINPDRTATVALRAEPQILVYTVTDTDGISSSAFIRVPGTQVTRPILDTTKVPVVVKAGSSVQINLNNLIIRRPGRNVLITDASKVWAGPGHDGSTLATSQSTITFGTDRAFSGRTNVVVEVTDGKDLNDPDGRVATVTIPIDVTPGDNRPPVFDATAVRVAAGEEAVAIDLAEMVTDPDGDSPARMTYTLTGEVEPGLTASISGTVLRVAADLKFPKGPAGNLQITVDDGRGGVVTGQLPVTVATSSRPLIQSAPINLTLAGDREETVDLAQLATNPFPQTPLTLVGRPAVTEGGVVSAEGTVLRISAAPGFSGRFTVTYTLADATADPDRHHTNVINVSVLGKPSPPTAITVRTTGSGEVEISWSPAEPNGSIVSLYRVNVVSEGNREVTCTQATICKLGGLRNGQEHSFTVSALNEVGWSAPSAVRNHYVDVVPGAPSILAAEPGDGHALLTWSAPANEGSAITGYEVSILGMGTRTFAPSAAGVPQKIDGLKNGTVYSFTVRAQNSARADQGWGPRSVHSRDVVPYGKPGPVGNLTVQADSIGTGTGLTETVRVSWTPPTFKNGREIEQYTVSLAGISKNISPEQTSVNFEASFSDSALEVSVVAINDFARFVHSEPALAKVWVLGQPPAPTLSAVTATGDFGTATLNWAPSPDGRGWRGSELSYQWSPGGGEWHPLNHNTLTGLPNGTPVTIKLRAVGVKGGVTAFSPEAVAPAPVTPYGPPTSPTISCASEVGRVRCTWSGGADGGMTTRYVLSGDASQEVGPAGSITLKGAAHSLKVACIQAVQAGGNVGPRNCASGTIQEFLRKYDVVKGQKADCNWDGCGEGEYHRVDLHLIGWPDDATVRCFGNFEGVDVETYVQMGGNTDVKLTPEFIGWPSLQLITANPEIFTTPWLTCEGGVFQP